MREQLNLSIDKMARSIVAVEFKPKKDNPRQVLIHQYLSTLDNTLCGSILEAMSERFLPFAMILNKPSVRDFRAVCLNSITSHERQIILIKAMLKDYEEENRPGVVFGDDYEDEDEDEDEDGLIIPLQVMQFTERD